MDDQQMARRWFKTQESWQDTSRDALVERAVKAEMQRDELLRAIKDHLRCAAIPPLWEEDLRKVLAKIEEDK